MRSETTCNNFETTPETAQVKIIWFGRRTWPVRFCIGWRVLNLFCASILELCSTEVESFVSIESSYSAEFALQFGKAWKRNFVSREFCNTFVLIGDGGLCLFVKKRLQRTNPSFRLNQLYKNFRLIARLLLEPE